ncbi:HAMP domain-containing histidine kinase [Desulfosarcina sp. OttesenSCG-928-A07]|nr:HAMP domain-containing histidine kinase [Desulfosarcina sp. OttesenSCG-928-G17]MDL2329706.1 HAMP domain-containing histidine kinase [Desulfosarcina sp. OttesenSCG-928-A07]
MRWYKKWTRRILPRTLSFRLTLWYAFIFSLSSAIAFLVFYGLITHALRQRMDGELSSKISEFTMIYTVQGLDAVKTTALIESQAAGEKKVFFRLLYASGVAFSSSNMSYWRSIGINRSAVHELVKEKSGRVFETLFIPDHPNQVRIAYGLIGQGVVVQIGYSMETDTAIITIFKKIFFITMSVLILAAALVGGLMARGALAGVEAVTRTARTISEKDLGQRVPVMDRHEEIDRLAITFNQMLDRIEKLVTGMREMGENIAHDLKSPVTRIRGMAEMTISGPAAAGEEMPLAAATIEECDRLLEMINTLLMISKTDAGVAAIQMEPVNMAEVARGAAALFSPLAEDKGLSLSCDTPDAAWVSGDLHLLQRAMANLVDNAIKYTPAPGTLWVEVAIVIQNKTKMVCVAVKDTGIGIDENVLPKVFDRFFRCDPSRTTSGSGLGLSLVRAVAHAHGGHAEGISEPDQGSCFTLCLPHLAKAPELT